MLVLGIETSCDETAVSVLRGDGNRCEILSEIISSQNKIHELYGGVVPELASREHLTNLPILTNEAIKVAGVKIEDVDLIAVTSGPGLIGCLHVGVSFAKGLALSLNKNLVGINHLEGHIFSPFILEKEIKFPFLALIVSGGHTEIVKVESLGHYTIIARTNDDAAGETFDKSANLLGFAYPGGASLATLADISHEVSEKYNFKLPKVMKGSVDFSFSGLKTAIALLIKDNFEFQKSEEAKAALCFAIQESIVETIKEKLELAIVTTGIKRVSISGGVSANQRLRVALQSIRDIELYFANKIHCTDNATMIAYCGLKRAELGLKTNIPVISKSRWPVESM